MIPQASSIGAGQEPQHLGQLHPLTFQEMDNFSAYRKLESGLLNCDSRLMGLRVGLNSTQDNTFVRMEHLAQETQVACLCRSPLKLSLN
jgi:hypothetical protein